jgi:hypothetical protein
VHNVEFYILVQLNQSKRRHNVPKDVTNCVEERPLTPRYEVTSECPFHLEQKRSEHEEKKLGYI